MSFPNQTPAEQFEVPDFNPVFNRLQGDNGGIKVKLAAAAALIATGAAAVVIFSQKPEQDIQENITEALGSVSSISAASLDCEPMITSDVSLITGTKLELPRWLAITSRVDTLPASGFLTFVRDETAQEFVKDSSGNDTDIRTKGKYQTLGCLPKSKVKVIDDLDGKTRQIEMDQSYMQLFTRKEADQTTLVFESPALSAMGEIFAKFSKLGSFGKFEKFENYVEETKAKVGSTTEQMAENFVEQKCFTTAYETTKQIVSLALIEQAKQDGFELAPADIKWTGSVPTFSGPYKLDGEDGSYKVEVDKYTVSQCEVNPDLLEAANNVEIEDTESTSSIRMEQ